VDGCNSGPNSTPVLLEVGLQFRDVAVFNVDFLAISPEALSISCNSEFSAVDGPDGSVHPFRVEGWSDVFIRLKIFREKISFYIVPKATVYIVLEVVAVVLVGEEVVNKKVCSPEEWNNGGKLVKVLNFFCEKILFDVFIDVDFAWINVPVDVSGSSVFNDLNSIHVFVVSAEFS